jgi:hypothetical protein
MSERISIQPTPAVHGGLQLPAVEIESYNVEIKDDGFVGDRANKGAFHDFVERWRKPLREIGEDPFGDEPSRALRKERLDALLTHGNREAAAIVQAAIEEFAHRLARVTRRFLEREGWREAERIVLGGGLSGTRVGELAIGRAAILLKAEKVKIELVPIRHPPNEAGLLGTAHLAPAPVFQGRDAMLAVDIGGTNVRVGVVSLNRWRSPTLSTAEVWKFKLWRHHDEKLGRDELIEGLVGMLKQLIAHAHKEGVRLAPLVGVGCPGLIRPDGSIDRGAHNLPGNWHARAFNLPAVLRAAIPRIDGFETAILMHNDAVVQGLSELPFMQDVQRWAAFTIGTGFGNALYANRKR